MAMMMRAALCAALWFLLCVSASADGVNFGIPGTFQDGILSAGSFTPLAGDGVLATVDINCRTGYGVNQSITGPVSGFFTVTRAAPALAYASDVSGNYSGFAANTLRQTSSGCLIEEARTNGIRNNVGSSGGVVADGVELLTNPTFNGCSGGTCSGWTVNLNGGTGSASFGGGTATLTGDGTHATLLTQSITTVAGRVYFIKVNVGTNPVTFSAGTTQGGVDLLAATATASSVGTAYTLSFTASGTTSWIGFSITAASSTALSVASTQWSGVLPTNWFFSGGGLNNGQMSYQVVGLGVESGIDYADIRVFGTPSATFNAGLGFDGFTNILANYGQTWTASGFYRIQSLSGGGLSNYGFFIGERNGIGGQVTTDLTLFVPSSTGALGANRISSSYTLTGAATAFAFPGVNFLATGGTAFDQTSRIGWPQLELNPNINASVSSSSLPTVAAAGTGYGTVTGGSMTWQSTTFVGAALESTGGSGCTAGLQTFTVSGGTGTAATMTATVAGGAVPAGSLTIVNPGSYSVSPGTTGITLTGGGCSVAPTANLTVGSCPTPPVLTVNASTGITAVTAVPTPGSCTVEIPSGATSGWTPGGGLTAGTGAAFNITPTNNAAQGFATSPIRTTGSAVTRNADVIVLNSAPAFSTSGLSYYVQGTPLSPNANTNLQIQLGLWNSSTTFNDYIRSWRGSGGFIGAMASGGVGQGVAAGTTQTASEYAYALVLATNRQANALNGTATTAANTDTLPTGINTVKVGNENSNNLFYNGYMERFAIWPTTAISNAGIQTLTLSVH